MSQSSRLTRFLDLPDGIAAGEALARAGESLESHREAALKVIDTAIGELATAGSQAPHDVLARLSDSIGGLAGMFRLEALGQAAKRLGDIVRLFEERGAADPDLIGLHIAALRALRVQTDPHGAAELLKGLEQIAARVAQRAG